jgi:hypothetical protein
VTFLDISMSFLGGESVYPCLINRLIIITEHYKH